MKELVKFFGYFIFSSIIMGYHMLCYIIFWIPYKLDVHKNEEWYQKWRETEKYCTSSHYGDCRDKESYSYGEEES